MCSRSQTLVRAYVSSSKSVFKNCGGNVKPFEEIPGPRSLPIIGTLWRYLPFIGEYRFDRLHKTGLRKLQQFGPVVREEIAPGQNVVWIFRPEDIQELLRKEGQYPQRRSHLAIQHIRLNKPEVYSSGGLLPTNGAEWYRLRRNFQKHLSSPNSVRHYLPQVNQIMDEFSIYMKNHYLPAPNDFLDHLNRLFLEVLGAVAFGTRFNAFSKEELGSNSHTSRLISAAFEANSCILGTDNGPQLWRIFPTPLFRRLRNAHEYMEKAAIKLIEEKQRQIENRENQSSPSCLVEHYLLSENLETKDIVGMGVDMILAGVDTTSFTSSFILYHLARNPVQQAKLYDEVSSVMGNETEVTESMLAQFNYVKAVFKEALRLNPVSVGVGRILAEDAVFSGYHVPKGTVVTTQSQVVCRHEEYFPNPDAFLPERWLKSSPSYEAVSPYLSIPFGHGPRTCIARRLAEQNMQLMIIKLIKEYSIEWTGGTLDCKSLLINKPDSSILLRFKRRK